jgi:hypothetical protein
MHGGAGYPRSGGGTRPDCGVTAAGRLALCGAGDGVMRGENLFCAAGGLPEKDA